MSEIPLKLSESNDHWALLTFSIESLFVDPENGDRPLSLKKFVYLIIIIIIIIIIIMIIIIIIMMMMIIIIMIIIIIIIII